MNDGTVESGYHMGAVDSLLALTVELDHSQTAIPPRVDFDALLAPLSTTKRQAVDLPSSTSFDYCLLDPIALEFFIDDRVIDMQTPSSEATHFSFPIPITNATTKHILMWLYSQEENAPPAHIILSSVRGSNLLLDCI